MSSETFSPEEREKVIGELQRCNVSPIVYSFIEGVEKVSWDVSKENEGKKRYISRRQNDKRMNPLMDERELYAGEVFYYTCIGEREELQPVHDVFSQDERFTCTLQQELYRPEFWCEIMPKKATKANAISRLKSMWHCDRVVSFGDAINDIPMFRISDECYAVENAVDELKKLATAVIDSNDSDGVAKWLESNVKI